MEPTSNLVQVDIPIGAICWQIKCEDCGSKYGVVQSDKGEKHPIFCVFCSHRITPTKVETRGRI